MSVSAAVFLLSPLALGRRDCRQQSHPREISSAMFPVCACAYDRIGMRVFLFSPLALARRRGYRQQSHPREISSALFPFPAAHSFLESLCVHKELKTGLKQ